MKLTRLLFLITFIIIGALAVEAQDDTRATATWQVQKYDVVANLPAADTDRSLTVKATLTVKNVSSSPASTLSLRISPNAEITTVTMNGASADFTKREETVGANGSLQRAAIRIPAVAPGSTATAVVNYKLTLKDNSGLGSLSPIGATFLPLSYWYPTPNSWFFSRGADYAPFQIKVNAPAGQTVISAGAEASGSFNQSLVGQPFFLSGVWDAVNSAGATVYMPKGSNADAKTRADELAKLAADAKGFMAGILGPAPDTQLRLVSARRGAGFSQGGTILIDEGVFRRSKIDSLTAMNIAEAIAKLWIGGSVAVAGDGQGAIREGLPRFLATEFIESKFGKDVADIERMRQRIGYFAVTRRDLPLSTVSSLDDYYFTEVANKGAMLWRLLDRQAGHSDFVANIQASMKDGQLDLPELRAAFSSQKILLDYMLDQATDMNLLIGLPQAGAAETKVALRNSGTIDATVGIEALTANGEKLKADATIRAASFGEVTFKTAAKITRVEIDSDKLYPQVEYSDDVAPKEFSDSDLLLAVKRSFDKQDYAGAESSARSVLRRYPRYDDVRILLARALLATGRASDAGTEFNTVLSEKLPAARSLAWANEGLAEVAVKSGQAAQAAKYADAAIMADAEYGASLAARNLRNGLSSSAAVDTDVKDFFARFDKAAVSNRKAEIDALVSSGDVTKFASGISGSTEQWQTQLRHVDYLDPNTALAEAALTIKLLNREQESGTAVFRLVRIGNQWKLAAVDMFEVR